MASNGNLDRTLDSIAKDRKDVRRSRPRRSAAAVQAKATTAKGPSNGVKKAKAAKPVVKAAAPARRGGESKIQVSGLPDDVSDSMLKDYFGEAVGPVKTVLVNYGPNGRSRGSATIIFRDATSATKALELDGVRVDNRLLRVEVLASSTDILPQVPVKTLSDRITKPKSAAKEKAKPAAAGKNGEAKAKPGPKANGKAEGGQKKKSGRAGRPKAKTVDELDAEMADYFGPGTGATNGNGAVQPAAASADTAMADEVL